MGGKISIKKRFFILTIIILLGFGFMGSYLLFSINKINNLSQDIVGSPYMVSDASKRIETNIIKMHRYMKDIVLANNDLNRSSFSNKVDSLENSVFDDLALIESNIDEAGRVIYQDTYDLFVAWSPIREEVKSLVSQGRFDDARDVTTGKGENHVNLLENNLSSLSSHAFTHINKSINDIGDRSRNTIIFAVVVLLSSVLIIVVISTYTLKGVLDSINYLNNTVKKVIDTKDFNVKPIKGNDEISELGESFNSMILSIDNLLDTKDSLAKFQKLLSSQSNTKDLRKEFLNYIMEKTQSEYSAFYSYNKNTEKFEFKEGTPCEDSNKRKSFSKGTGLIGLVGNSFQAKHIDNINDADIVLELSSMKVKPKGVYVFPIGYSENLIQGVVEIASSKGYDEDILQFINTMSVTLPPYSSNLEKKEEIIQLLNDTEKLNQELMNKSRALESNAAELESSNVELEQTNEEMEKMNIELQNQKKELIKNTRELSRANRTKTDFLANMSHELRTPLNSIILISDMLSRKKILESKDIEKIEIVKNASTELLDLINNLLNISKIESGKMEVIKEEVSTINIGERMKKKFEDTAKSKDITFVVEDNLMAEFKTDKRKLEQILNNFLSNAFKFTRKGEVKLIFERSDDKDFDYKISVEDTGIGIKEEKQTDIFEKFNQGDSSITREFGGTGLGLTISTEMATLLGGKLKIESELNSGSKFSLYLPGKKNTVDTSSKIEKRDSEVLSDKVENEDMFVLLIEDSEEFIREIKPYINKMGFKVVAALTGYEGITKASTNKPDGIILDLVLPDISGGRVLKELKMNPATRGVPVHVMSFKDGDNVIDLKKMGAIGYTQKTPNLELDAKEVLDSIIKIKNKMPKSILIVEDDDIEAKSLINMFNSWDLKIDISKTSSDGIDKIKNNDYDAIVLDLKLKNSNGLDVCKLVKEESISVPIIIYTAKSLTEEEYRQLEKYSDSIILKNADSKGNLLEEVAIFIHKIYDWKDGKTEITVEYKDLEGRKILICDDDSRNIFALTSLLEDFGVEVTECYNGKEALDVLSKDSDFDLILMDIMMPIMDGFTAIKKIKEQKEIKNIPVIALTAKAMKEDRESCLAAGADDYMSKPIDMDLLIKLIDAWVNKE